MSTPAERYAASRQRIRHPDLVAFERALPFELDGFQRDACLAVSQGHSVLVAAPTGAGKTLVGEFAVRHAHDRGEKAFYTTPIKALSNQKFNDLCAQYGTDAVGLLTGDTTVNPDADIVVMTTEVLRNMIYAGSSSLDRLAVVVLDEVHYLADRERGSVWEEVIIHLELSCAIIALSATVSNAEEFGAWLREVRGDARVIVSEHRPVPLWPHVFMREGIFDLYAPSVNAQDPGPNARLNPELEAIAKRDRHDGARPLKVHGHTGRAGRPVRSRRSPPRFAVVDVLDQHGLLPAIVFVFSRAGCDDAVDQVRHAGIVLTSAEERERIRSIIDDRCAAVPPEDLGALDFAHWRDNLEAGIAAHHAGMIPLFKEVVEQLFSLGLIKVVYATETLALGINMPARSVVLEKLVKWDGQGHKDLTAGEYTQLTGRAGRRGIDVEGHAVVVDHPQFDVAQLGRLASRRTYPLVSSFKPSYNMAINLVANLGVLRAREVLEMSFAQYQADESVVGKARRVRELETAIAGYRESALCELGDFMEYARLRNDISRGQKGQARAAGKARRDATVSTLAGLRRGDVVRVGGGKRSGLSVVTEPDADATSPRPSVVSEQGRSFRLSANELHHGLEVVGAVAVPKRFNARDAVARREIGQVIAAAKGSFELARRRAEPERADDSIDELGRALRRHPCHACPDRETHARWAERYFRTLRDKDRLVGEIDRATGSISRLFDKRCRVLGDMGYLEDRDGAVVPTPAGTALRRLYSENDLVIAECLRSGVWDSLSPAGLAAVLSSLLYNGRRDDDNRSPRVPGGPTGGVGTALTATMRVWSALDDLHREYGMAALASPQWGIVGPIHQWAQGKTLGTALAGTELSPGDMVRWCKQVIDALDQIADSGMSARAGAAARTAITAMRRGVVAY